MAFSSLKQVVDLLWKRFEHIKLVTKDGLLPLGVSLYAAPSTAHERLTQLDRDKRYNVQMQVRNNLAQYAGLMRSIGQNREYAALQKLVDGIAWGSATLPTVRRQLSEAIGLQGNDSIRVRNAMTDFVHQQIKLLDAQVLPRSGQEYAQDLNRLIQKHPQYLDKALYLAVRQSDLSALNVGLKALQKNRFGGPDEKALLSMSLGDQKYSLALQLLKNNFPLHINSKTGFNELHDAIRFSHVLAVKMLLHFHPQASIVQTGDGLTPLYLALQGNHSESFKALLDAGANINQANNSDGRTPIHLAAETGKTKVLSDLLRQRGNPNMLSRDGKTPLLLAIEKGQQSAVAMLLNHGVDINQPINGRTPLETAVRRMDKSMIAFLVSHGARADRKLRIVASEVSRNDPAITNLIRQAETGAR